MNGGRRALFALFVFLTFFSSVATGQKTKTQLQKEKQKNLEKIQETEKILDETSRQKKNSIGELSALNQRIRNQEDLMASIKSEIKFLEADIDENNGIIEALERDLGKLKEEYAAMVFSAQKASGKSSKLLFLFSSESFDQLLMRLKYMEQYGNARQEQASAIGRVQKLLESQVVETEKIRSQKNALLEDEIKESNQLASLKKKQKSVVRTLEKDEKRLKNELEDTKKAIALLDKKINEIIKEEMERAAREARDNNATKVAEAAGALSTSFEENKSKFPWPASGFISQKFGRQAHPVLKGIVLQNDGINIQTQQNETVKAIFEGEVRRVAFIPALGSTVIINHGEYFTVYSGLKEVSVKMGQKVVTNQELGHVLVNTDGISELRFQIRKNTLALDPQAWLKD